MTEEFVERDSIDYLVEGHDLFEIVNFNEPLVLAVMREVYGADPTLCRCLLCVEDVFALALNTLPPRYIQPTSLRAYELSRSFIDEEAVRKKVVEAVEKVKASPKH